MSILAFPDQEPLTRLTYDASSALSTDPEFPEGTEAHAVEDERTVTICGKDLGSEPPAALGPWEGIGDESPIPACGVCSLLLSPAPGTAD